MFILHLENYYLFFQCRYLNLYFNLVSLLPSLKIRKRNCEILQSTFVLITTISAYSSTSGIGRSITKLREKGKVEKQYCLISTLVRKEPEAEV